MAENLKEDYYQKTPQELQAELMLLFQQLPPLINYDVTRDELANSIINSARTRITRQKSTHRESLMDRLDAMLKVISDTSTLVMYSQIHTRFRACYLNGIDKNNPESTMTGRNFYWLLDAENPDSGTFFNPVLTVHFERRLYRERQSYELEQIISKKLAKDAPLEIAESMVREKLELWERLFIDTYGVAP